MQLRPDNFTLALVGTVALGCFLPAQGLALDALGGVTTLAIGVMFFLHGARLSRDEVVAGIVDWKLHLVILVSTFVFFPLVGLALARSFPALLGPQLWLGVLFVCALPSTVQSAIAFTSIARGNVPAAICAATASNLFGIFLTPVLAGVMLRLHGAGISVNEVWKIALQLLFPFVAGHLLRPWIGDWAHRNETLLNISDRGSILLVVYTAFSEAVLQGIWHQLPLSRLLVLACVNGAILAAALLVTTYGSRLLGFSRADEAAIVFCGSKKSLASGIPMANVLFSGAAIGMMVVPLMIFHQMQLIVCAALAHRYAARVEVETKPVLIKG